MQKKGVDAWTAEKEKERDAKPAYRVIFKPDNREVSVPEGSTLLEAAVSADVHLNASCNGKGSCDKCKLIVEFGRLETKPSAQLSESEKEKKYVLACQSRVVGDVTVKIPPETLEKN